MFDDTPEFVEDKYIAEKIIIDDLQERIDSNKKRLKKKVDVKGNKLNKTQLNYFKTVIENQGKRLQKLAEKYTKKINKARQNG